MKITDIRSRRKGIVCVVADGEEFLLNCDTVAAAGLKKGTEITESEIKKLTEQSDTDRAKSRALWYLSRADHSRKALYDKLCRAFSPAASTAAVERMEELGLIDDLAYARRLAKYWSESNISQNEIVRKLFVKGVPRDIARAAAEECNSDPAAQIAALLSTKYKTRLSSEDGVKKVYAALLRKGFSFGDVKAALRNYSEKINYSEE